MGTQSARNQLASALFYVPAFQSIALERKDAETQGARAVLLSRLGASYSFSNYSMNLYAPAE